MKCLPIIVLLFFIVLNLSGTNYYFSSINGDDSNSGTSASEAKATMAALQQLFVSLTPGDTVFFERGSVWYGTYLILSSRAGTADNPIVFDAYGEGTDPVLSGQKILSSPTKDGNIYTFEGNGLPYVFLSNKSYGRRMLSYVTIGGKPYLPARYPNKGYMQSNTTNRISVTDNSQSWAVDQWKDGWVALKPQKWICSVARITSNTDVKITNTDHDPYTPFGSQPYFIINAYGALDLDGEWFFTDNQLSVYWSQGQLPEVKASVVDQVLMMNRSDYIHFNNITFMGGNYYCAKLTNCDYTRFNHCRFIGAGEFGIRIYGIPGYPPGSGDESENNVVTYCEISDCGIGGIFMRYCRGGSFTHNYLHRIAIYAGYQNKTESNEVDGYTIDVYNNKALPTEVKYNFLDSVQAGVASHFNGDVFTMEGNVIRNYGMGDLSDKGGIYAVSDPTTPIKSVKRNFFLDVHEPDHSSQTVFYSNSYTCAVYLEQDSYRVHADSNSIENSQISMLTNGGKMRSFSYNNVLNPLTHESIIMEHRCAIANGYNIPMQTGIAEQEVVTHNNIAFGEIGDIGYKFDRNASSYGCEVPIRGQIDYNNWFDPHNVLTCVAQVNNNYAPQYKYNLAQWQAASFECDGDVVDPGDSSTFNNTAYADVKLLKNWSANNRYFKLDAEYVDVDGNEIKDSVEVSAFFSKLIFLVSGTEGQSDMYIDSTLVPLPIAVAPAEIVVSSPEIKYNLSTINIYPNPVADRFTVSGLYGNCVISVYDLVGRKVKEVRTGNQEIQLSMEGFKSGAYLVHVAGSDLKSYANVKILKH